jgi:hypothetical protein
MSQLIKISDLVLILPNVTNGWTLGALVAVLVFLYASRRPSP